MAGQNYNGAWLGRGGSAWIVGHVGNVDSVGTLYTGPEMKNVKPCFPLLWDSCEVLSSGGIIVVGKEH